MFNMANDGVLKVCFLLFTVLYFVNNVNCSLSSTEYRMLNSKFELMRIGVHYKLLSAFVKIEIIRDSVRTCKCNEYSNANAGMNQIAGQPDQSKFNEIEKRNNKTLQTSIDRKSNEIERRNNKTLRTSIDRVANSFNEEKKARKAFEKEMLDLVRDLTTESLTTKYSKWEDRIEVNMTVLGKQQELMSQDLFDQQKEINETLLQSVINMKESLTTKLAEREEKIEKMVTKLEKSEQQIAIKASEIEKGISNQISNIEVAMTALGEKQDRTSQDLFNQQKEINETMLKSLKDMKESLTTKYSKWEDSIEVAMSVLGKQQERMSQDLFDQQKEINETLLQSVIHMEESLNAKLTEREEKIEKMENGISNEKSNIELAMTALSKKQERMSQDLFNQQKEMNETWLKSVKNMKVHGGWADWAQWGECSQSCGTGLMKRSRQCSNPYPGPHGNPCFGDSTDIKLCVLRECTQVDGGWSGWTLWSGCSTTCNAGLRTRDRHCNNPRPSSQGSYCDGPNRDTQSCNTKTCPDPIVFFSVDRPRDPMVNDVVVFKRTIAAYSSRDYSTTTGKFTCKIPGLYHFFVTFTSHENSGDEGNVYCRIRKNNVNKTHAYNSAFGYYKAYKEYTRNWRSASASVYLRLVKGDKVWVGGCYNWDNIGKDDAFLFVGALITAS